MKRKIVFFYNDSPQKQLLDSLNRYINKKKFTTSFSKNFQKKVDIGVYAHDADKLHRINANISIITLGGMDQGKLFWPNFWLKENWSKFDFGILPGNNWIKMWKNSSWFIHSRPKKAILKIGWPKSQQIKLSQNKKKIRKPTILYAPCFETDQKQLDVVNAIKNKNYNLLIKHLPWDTSEEKIQFKDVRQNISIANIKSKNILKKNLKIINPKKNIMEYYSKADLLITDESSVMYEALLFNLPTLVCSDWPMRTNNKNKPRKIKLDKSVSKITNKKNLSFSIDQCLNNLKKLKLNSIKKKEYHFSSINKSASNFNLFLENYCENKKILFQVKPKFKVSFTKSLYKILKKKFQ